MTTAIPTDLIAPCGMNCRLCWGFIREHNACPGCLRINHQDTDKSKYRSGCTIRNCEYLAKVDTKYCSESCDKFPCTRLKNLDKRYRSKYGMSMIENLAMIHEIGIRKFIQNEKLTRICPECGDLICVHKPACLLCGHRWN
jgi:hypothetical protein